MDYQEIENKLIEFAHKKEGKDLPVHGVSIGTAVDFAIELIKNCKRGDSKCTCETPSPQTHWENNVIKWTCFKCKKPT